MNRDVASLPVFRNADSPAVGTHVVVLYGNCRRIAVEIVFPGIADIEIDRIAIAVEFPHSRDRHSSPVGVVEVRSPEIGRTLVCILDPVEFPFSVEREVVLAVLHSLFHLFEAGIGKEVSVHRRTVDLSDIRVLPLVEALRTCRKDASQGEQGACNFGKGFHNYMVLVLFFSSISLCKSSG